jgi:hypothetical protein
VARIHENLRKKVNQNDNNQALTVLLESSLPGPEEGRGRAVSGSESDRISRTSRPASLRVRVFTVSTLEASGTRAGAKGRVSDASTASFSSLTRAGSEMDGWGVELDVWCRKSRSWDASIQSLVMKRCGLLMMWLGSKI